MEGESIIGGQGGRSEPEKQEMSRPPFNSNHSDLTGTENIC